MFSGDIERDQKDNKGYMKINFVRYTCVAVLVSVELHAKIWSTYTNFTY